MTFNQRIEYELDIPAEELRYTGVYSGKIKRITVEGKNSGELYISACIVDSNVTTIVPVFLHERQPDWIYNILSDAAQKIKESKERYIIRLQELQNPLALIVKWE